MNGWTRIAGHRVGEAWQTAGNTRHRRVRPRDTRARQPTSCQQPSTWEMMEVAISDFYDLMHHLMRRSLFDKGSSRLFTQHGASWTWRIQAWHPDHAPRSIWSYPLNDPLDIKLRSLVVCLKPLMMKILAFRATCRQHRCEMADRDSRRAILRIGVDFRGSPSASPQ